MFAGGRNGKIRGKEMSTAQKSCEYFLSMAINQSKIDCRRQVVRVVSGPMKSPI